MISDCCSTGAYEVTSRASFGGIKNVNVIRWVIKIFFCLGIEETVYSMGSVLI